MLGRAVSCAKYLGPQLLGAFGARSEIIPSSRHRGFEYVLCRRVSMRTNLRIIMS